jgi:tRNA dimethylallyltransferase
MDTASHSLLRRAVFLAGPTSVGKSEIALTLAEKHHGEIVCADAFQLYREFPVLSAQPSAAERARVVHHLSGTVPCSDEMDAARFASLALLLRLRCCAAWEQVLLLFVAGACSGFCL